MKSTAQNIDVRHCDICKDLIEPHHARVYRGQETYHLRCAKEKRIQQSRYPDTFLDEKERRVV